MAGFELFCERCGQRYGGQEEATRRPLGQRLLNAVGFGATATAAPEEPLLRFCLACRGYSCPSCWNDEAGFCQTCVPMPEPEFVPDPVVLPELPSLPSLPSLPLLPTVPDPVFVPQPIFAAVDEMVEVSPLAATPEVVVAAPDVFAAASGATPEPAPAPVSVDVPAPGAERVPEYPWEFALDAYADTEQPFVAEAPAADDPAWAMLDAELELEPQPEPQPVAAAAEPTAATPEPEPVAIEVAAAVAAEVAAEPTVELPGEPLPGPVAAESWTDVPETPALIEEVPPAPPVFIPLPPLGPIITPPRPAPSSLPSIAFDMPDTPPAFLLALPSASAPARPALPAGLFDGQRPNVRPCPNCDLPVSAAARFCRRCGSAQA
ncbi:MAG TPA: hypothetical protein VMZ33_00475 [Candidatus Limnocylindrales bacterium]|nr:hypothetical protein [Candidatus Limnocylindrales bacterium]